MAEISPEEYKFIEELGLLMERSGGYKTLGRVFGYLLLSGRPRTLDEIARDLLFSKATASLTIRRGMVLRFFEKVSVPGDRKDYYRANVQSWIGSMSDQIKAINDWERLIEYGLGLVPESNRAAVENLSGVKDYFSFLRWYLSDLEDQYNRWKKAKPS